VVVLCPAVLWYAPAYAALIAVNLVYARRRAERALVNDLASVAQSCLMVLVAATVAGVPVVPMLPVAAAVAAYFTGTVLYVKTMIRERDSAPYYWASVGFHAAALALAAWVSWPLLGVFVLLLVRAAVNPRLGLTPKQVGLTEIAASVLVLMAVAL
jgi:hypothetical protein